jgi:hypothetical protein
VRGILIFVCSKNELAASISVEMKTNAGGAPSAMTAAKPTAPVMTASKGWKRAAVVKS